MNEFELWCYLKGDRTIFDVFILSSQNVSALKAVIYDKIDVTCKVKDLILSKIDVDPQDPDVKRLIKAGTYDPTSKSDGRSLPEHDLRLNPMKKMLELWPEKPLETRLHVFIRLPGNDTPPTPVSKASDSFEKWSNVRVEKYEGLPRISPSELGRPDKFFCFQKEHSTFYMDRPMDPDYDIPPTLLHPVFGEFLDDCETHKPSPDDYSLAHDLVSGMSQHFQDEHRRVDRFCKILGKYGIRISGTKLENQPTSYRTDGDMQEGGFRFVILEAKNEISEGGAEPLLQAMCYYQQSVGGTDRAKMQIAKYPNSRLPCLLICLVGPMMLFAGAAYTVRPHIQTLSTPLGLCFHRSETRRRSNLARHIGAFRKAIDKLRSHYKTLSPPEPGQDSSGLSYPYQSTFIDLLSKGRVSFTYKKPRMKGTPIFEATLADGKPIMVKFVQRYSRDAHEKCANLGCAPKLHGFEELPGGWLMVVMEYLPSDKYHTPNNDVLKTTNLKLYNAMKKALENLHQEGLVHGDIRDANVMVENEGQSGFMFLDFDWSGRINEVEYPPNVNMASEMNRPTDVGGGKKIWAEHDMHMLRVMFRMGNPENELPELRRSSRFKHVEVTSRSSSSQRRSRLGPSAMQSASSAGG